MSQEPFFSSLQIKIKHFEYQVRQFWKEVWPFKWDIWQEPKALLSSITISPYPLKVIAVTSFVVTLISSLTLFYGFYIALTVDAAADGGRIQEGIVGSNLSYFNPVIDSTSEAEQKINALLYHPLYTVQYPDFLNDSTTEPVVTPVLVKAVPTWTDLGDADANNHYKTLRFELRDDIFWSDGQPISVKDVVYSFERIKEDKGNSQFKSAFSAVSIKEVPGNSLQFDLVSERPNPQLVFASNFSPISSQYYGFQIADRLLTDSRSFAPTVTSGFFRFDGDTIADPDNLRGEKVANPIRDSIKNTIKTVVLTKNSVQNYKNVKLNTYIIRRADTLLRVGGQDDNSLEKLVSEKKVDIFTRSLGSNLNLSSADVLAKLGLNQKIVPTNTYFDIYLNIQINDYFINQSLRQYVLCNLLNYQLNSLYASQLEIIPADKRLIPVQLGSTAPTNCANPDQLLDPTNYSIEVDERTGIKQVLLRGKPFVINLVGFPESEPLLTDIQLVFRDMGVPAELINDARIGPALSEKSYNVLFIPVTIASRDPYALLGSGGRDFSQIRLNNRINDYDAEKNLYAYSLSNLNDQTAKDKLVKFFGEQYVMANLFRSNLEINYSNQVNGINGTLPNVSTFSNELYNGLPQWYSVTKKEWIFK